MTADDPFALLDAERERIDRFYATLPADQWKAPTACVGWDRKDLLAHLIGVEEYTEACLADRVAAYQADTATDYTQGNEVLVRRRADRSPEELLTEWRRRIAENHRQLRGRGAQATMATSVGPYPLGRQAYYLACELAIHADDAGVPVEPGEAEGRLRWRRAFGLDALSEVVPQARVEETRVEGTVAGVTVRLDGESATLSDADFVAATSGRLPDTHPLPAALRSRLAVLT